jgi:hypothetical protein
MTLVKFVVTENPMAKQWRLQPAQTASCFTAVLGWVLPAPPVDAGVPLQVARILARAFAATGNVTFLSANARGVGLTTWTRIEGGWARTASPSMAERLRGATPFSLFCTREVEHLVKLFDEPTFPWELGGQMVLLSNIDDPFVEISHRSIELLFGPDNPCDTLRNSLPTSTVLVRPGPDGDFAIFASSNRSAWQGVRNQIADQSGALGIPFEVVDEPQFNATCWLRER